MKRYFSAMAVMLFGAVLCFGELAAQSSDLEAPRSPKRYRVTNVEQLLPNARILVRRPWSWLIGAQYGLGLKEGEKLLIVAGGMNQLVGSGHLTVLDDPEVRRAAAKYGDPDELLREDWIPEFEEPGGRVIFPPYEND